MWKSVALLTLLLGASNPLRAATFSLQVGNVIWVGSPGGYNCFGSTAYPNTVNFTITKVGNGAASYAVTAGTSATSGTYTRQLASGANRLNYQLYTSSALTYILEAPPTANANQVLSGSTSAKSGTVLPLSFIFYVPSGQAVAPGTYTDQVIVSTYSRYNDTAAPQATTTITLTVSVAPVASLALVPTGGAFISSSSQTLDFGTLAASQSKGCDLLIRKNTGCSIALNSQNLGNLKLKPSGPETLGYQFTLNGTLLNLSQTATITLPSGISPSPNGSRLPISVTTGDASSATAGDYQDQVTITVTAQ